MSTPATQVPAEVDERQPLLAEGEIERHLDVNPIDANGSLSQESKKTRSRLRVASYILLGLISVFLLAIFIKGWIDADDVEFDLGTALQKALGGGLSGAAAMVLQVFLFMPLRTVMNYQYRFGTSTTVAMKTLYAEGGFGRFYQGIGAALIQAPVSRFGDTAANAGILALLSSNTYLNKLPRFIKTIFASIAAAGFKMILMPIDTLKTTLQAQGKSGWNILRRRIKQYGLGTLWYGALATAGASLVGHYPWFATYNTLDEQLPMPPDLPRQLLRQAFIGFVASVVSDTVSNSLRVVKTYRQVNEENVGYREAARRVIAVDGTIGLFGRGLKTRIIANGLQGLTFSVLWKLFLDLWDKYHKV